MRLKRTANASLQGDTRLVGVFGWPVAHSLSPAMHNAAFAALEMSFAYVPFAVRPEALETALRGLEPLGVVGVNLTIPHKERALPLMDEATGEARRVGAVNTVHCVEGRLIGDNTDGHGFHEPLREMGFEVAGRGALIVGAGGAARSVTFRLAEAGARITLANRTIERAERLAEAVAEATGVRPDVIPLEDVEKVARALRGAELLVQTTKVGMHPDATAPPPVPVEALHPDLLVYDLVYNPLETELLRQARRRGCRTLTGVKMLVFQGAAAFERWTGRRPPTDVMEKAVLMQMYGVERQFPSPASPNDEAGMI